MPSGWKFIPGVFLGILLGCLSSTGSSGASPEISPLAKKHWEKLLHVDNPSQSQGFYLAAPGAIHPEEELKLFLEQLNHPTKVYGHLKLPAACAFPARTLWVKRNSPDVPIHPERCPDFERWSAGLDAESISLVFSSYYPNNPASMFGHTFLRIHHRTQVGHTHSPLLDYGANFSAQVNGPRWLGILYVVHGLFGGYEGYYDLDPYYRKITEYHAQEDRDLWEYELNFTLGEMQIAIAHLWELWNASSFQYFFLTKNCSYQPLAFFDAIRPEAEFTSRLGMTVYPVSTLKILAQDPNLIRTIRHIPSLKKKLQTEWVALPPDSQSHFRNKNYLDPTLLGFASRYFQYQKLSKSTDLSSADELLQRKILLKIAETKTPDLSPPPSLYESGSSAPPPHEAHDPSQLGIGTLITPGNSAALVRFRAGFHDSLDPWRAMLPGSQIRYGDASFLIRKDSFKINEITWVDIQSMNPISFLNTDTSWKLDLSTLSLTDDRHCLECFSALGAEVGPGLSISDSKKSRFLGAFITLHSALAPRLQKGVRAGTRAFLVSAIQLHERIRATSNLGLSADWIAKNQDLYRPMGEFFMSADVHPRFEIRAGIQKSLAPVRTLVELRLFL